MNLRPHHLLCVQKFTGHGYDEAFTAHMTALTARLRQEPETPVTLTRGCDELCACCPNRREDRCETLEKVERMDAGVLELLDLSCGEIWPWETLRRRVLHEILSTEQAHLICGGCCWEELCQRTEITL